MARRADIERLVERLREILPQVVAVYVFGTYGTEAERPESDIDLAVYARRPLPAKEVWFAAQELASLAGRDVDLVDLGAASTVMRAQVVSTGERLWCRDETACELFEDYVYASYARLQEQRRGIVEDVLRRGNVHGR